MAVLIYGPSTAGGRSTPFIARSERHVTLISSGLAAAETGLVQISPNDGKTWVQSPVAQLDAANNNRTATTPGLYSVNVSASVAPVSVWASTEDNA